MPRLLSRLLLAAALMVAVSARAQDGWEDSNDPQVQQGYDVQVDVEGAGAVNLQSFESGLAPYGDWVQTGSYGTAWRPRVAAGWRPYYYGRWEWTNEGWLWVSEEPFGWATFHYGRWAFDGGQGWLWVPGYQWAPAWVTWRYGGDAVGWAPLAPGLSLYVTNYAFVGFWWTFVPTQRFCGAPVWGIAYDPGYSNHYYGATSPAPPRPRAPGAGSPGGGMGQPRPPGGGHPTPAWGGPSPRAIEERSGRPVIASRIVPESRPGAVRGRSGEIGVYRPELTRPGGGVRSGPPSWNGSPGMPSMHGGRGGAVQPRYSPPPAGSPSPPRYAPPPSGNPAQPRYAPPSSGNPAQPRYAPPSGPSAPRHQAPPASAAPPPPAPHEGRSGGASPPGGGARSRGPARSR